MCAETACLALRLEGPLQSWGTSSQYNRRRTDLLPSRSAITGMLCAALGLDRGSSGESTFLREMAAVHMLAVAVPRCAGESVLSVQRLEDYHTVQHTAKADGKLKDCHITQRGPFPAGKSRGCSARSGVGHLAGAQGLPSDGSCFCGNIC